MSGSGSGSSGAKSSDLTGSDDVEYDKLLHDFLRKHPNADQMDLDIHRRLCQDIEVRRRMRIRERRLIYPHSFYNGKELLELSEQEYTAVCDLPPGYREGPQQSYVSMPFIQSNIANRVLCRMILCKVEAHLTSQNHILFSSFLLDLNQVQRKD